MLTVKEAQRIGIEACIDKIGRDFVVKHRDSSSSSYSTEADEHGYVFCFVGVSDQEPDRRARPRKIVLDSTSKFPYHASCVVMISDGRTKFLDYRRPSA